SPAGPRSGARALPRSSGSTPGLTLLRLRVSRQPVEACAPEESMALEPIHRDLHRPGLHLHPDRAADLGAPDETGGGQDVEVLEHRRQGHRKGLGEIADRESRRLLQPRQDATARRIAERRENAIQTFVARSYHQVKCLADDGGVSSKGLLTRAVDRSYFNTWLDIIPSAPSRRSAFAALCRRRPGRLRPSIPGWRRSRHICPRIGRAKSRWPDPPHQRPLRTMPPSS